MKRWYQHHYHNTFSLKLIFGIVPTLPKWMHPPIAGVTALLFFFVLRVERKAVSRNLAMVCHGAGRAELLWKTYRVFYSFCDLMVSYCYIPTASHAQLRAMLTDPDQGEAAIERCLSLGNGLIVWTAHVGNWELASRLLEMHGRRVHVARAVERGNPAEMLLRDMMMSERLRIIPVNEDELASVELLRALRQNEIVGIQGDRTYEGRSAEVSFFGEQVELPLGPFFLSHVAGAPVLPGVVVRTGWLRYRVIVGEPILPAQTGNRERDVVDGLQRAAAFLEDVIATYHWQWLNFYEFWPSTSPTGETAGVLKAEANKA